MRDLRRLTVLAVIMLVVLRVSIGWQLLYEGMWKVTSWSTARPWTAEGYLRNSQGPFREIFRDMSGDPDDFDWLDYDVITARWDDWHERFLKHHTSLTDRQKAQLDEMLNGKSEYVSELKQMPEGVEFRGSLGNVIQFNEKRERLIVDGTLHLTPSEYNRLLRLAPDPENASEEQKAVIAAYKKAVENVYKRSSRLSFKERLAVSLKADPARVGQVYTGADNEVVEERMGDIGLYHALLDRYEENRAKASQDFQYDHLATQWGEIQQLRSKLIGPIKALDAELKDKADSILTLEQLAEGPVPSGPSPVETVNLMTVAGLLILGGLLIFGLFSRFAAFGAAFMLTQFYLAFPPWPGVPPAPGPEHSLIVDKLFIEIVALLALTCIPTGRWFGLDAIVGNLWGRLRSRSKKPSVPADTRVAGKPAPTSTETTSAPAETSAAT